MQGQRNHERPFYRCRYPTEDGLANKTEHPRDVYLAERDLIGPLDALYAAQPDLDVDPAAAAAAARSPPTGAHVTLAIGYGGRQEIVEGLRDLFITRAADGGSVPEGLSYRGTTCRVGFPPPVPRSGPDRFLSSRKNGPGRPIRGSRG
jgi:hypothetical protein